MTVATDAVLERLSVLQAEPGDVVVIHDADTLDTPDTSMVLADVAKRLDVLIVCLPSGSTLEVLTPEQMTKLGWARADTISRVVAMADPEPADPA